jgi:hypothetical protein
MWSSTLCLVRTRGGRQPLSNVNGEVTFRRISLAFGMDSRVECARKETNIVIETSKSLVLDGIRQVHIGTVVEIL